MSGYERSKGRRGQTAAVHLLQSRDWTVVQITSGVSDGDLLITSAEGVTYLCEVKATKAITTQHRAQAMVQAKARKLPWVLMSHIDGTSSWLVQMTGKSPAVWRATA